MGYFSDVAAGCVVGGFYALAAAADLSISLDYVDYRLNSQTFPRQYSVAGGAALLCLKKEIKSIFYTLAPTQNTFLSFFWHTHKEKQLANGHK